VIYETGSGLAKTELRSEGTDWTVQDGNSCSVTFQDGQQVVYIRATDNVGNTMTFMVSFTVDTVAPTLLTISPFGSSESTLAVVNVTFSEEMNSSSTTVAIAGIEGTAVWYGNNLSFTPSAALMGRTSYSVTVNGMDLAGNPISQSWTFMTAVVGKISGVVYGRDGKILPNMEVKLIGQSAVAQTEMNGSGQAGSNNSVTVRVTKTDANGVYVFYDVAIGNYTLEFTESGYLAKSTAVVMTAEAVDKGGLTVDPGAAVYNPINGVLLFVIVAAITVAMAGLMLFLRRRKSVSASTDRKPKERKSKRP
jgi:hypothetical protein